MLPLMLRRKKGVHEGGRSGKQWVREAQAETQQAAGLQAESVGSPEGACGGEPASPSVLATSATQASIRGGCASSAFTTIWR